MLHTVFVIIFVQYKLYHGVRLVVRISRNRRENLTVIELTDTQHFKRLFERTLNIQNSSETICYDHSILETKGESLFIVDLNWDLKSSFNPSHLQPAQQELQNRGMKI